MFTRASRAQAGSIWRLANAVSSDEKTRKLLGCPGFGKVDGIGFNLLSGCEISLVIPSIQPVRTGKAVALGI